jgi:insertion element IS1 protein InsB
MECKYCNGKCQKAGRQKNGAQKIYCITCNKYQQAVYQYTAASIQFNKMISMLVCESVSIRGIARILKIAAGTVISRIKSIALSIGKPPVPINRNAFEVDEMITYIGRKQNQFCIAYALCGDTKKVIDFVVGKRNKRTLKMLINTLLLSNVATIKTDKFNIYQSIIPKNIHSNAAYETNHIERKNLSIRTHLKRLSRRTICFSKSMVMLQACLKIYFWCCCR